MRENMKQLLNSIKGTTELNFRVIGASVAASNFEDAFLQQGLENS